MQKVLVVYKCHVLDSVLVKVNDCRRAAAPDAVFQAVVILFIGIFPYLAAVVCAKRNHRDFVGFRAQVARAGQDSNVRQRVAVDVRYHVHRARRREALVRRAGSCGEIPQLPAVSPVEHKDHVFRDGQHVRRAVAACIRKSHGCRPAVELDCGSIRPHLVARHAVNEVDCLAVCRNYKVVNPVACGVCYRGRRKDDVHLGLPRLIGGRS